MDDKPQILKNHRLQINELNFSQIWQAAHSRIGSGTLYRPVACVSLALNWYFGQDNVFGYHFVNFLIHCSTAWLLFLTIKLLFSTPRLQRIYSSGEICFIAVLASLFWALNPIQVQAVTYIVQRMASLSALFSLLTIFCYLKARLSLQRTIGTVLFACAALSYLLAIFSKENAATVLLALPVIELLFFQLNLSRQIVKKIALGTILGCVVAVLSAFALRPELFDFIANYYSNRPFTLNERFLTEQRIILFYLSQLFFPAPYRLSVEHDIILSTSLLSPWTTAAAIFINLFFVLLAVRLGRRFPLISLAVIFFYLNHIVESTIVPLELLFEHRNYLPSLFLFIPVAQGGLFLLRKSYGNKIVSSVLIGTITLLLGVEGYATYQRNISWKSEESLWLDALSKAPNSARPIANLALKLAWGPDTNEAKLRKALELTEHTLSMRMARKRLDAAQLANMGAILTKLGEYEKAINYFDQSLELSPEAASTRYNLCKTLIMTGDFSRARDELLFILDKGWVHADYFNMLGFIYLWTGDPGKALPVLQQAIRYAPGRPDVLLTLGKCFSMLEEYKKANWFYHQARKRGEGGAVLSLCLIENNLKANWLSKSRQELERSMHLFSLNYFLNPLQAPDNERFRSVPLANEVLTPFLQTELPQLTNDLLP